MSEAEIQTLGADDGFVAHMSHDDPHEDCDWCAVRPMLSALRDVWDNVHGEAAFDLMWSLQDGYGEPGYMPDQGYDWSGVRDSSPDCIRFMYSALFGSERSVR